MSTDAWVTLATNDSYCLGALVLANSLRRVGTTKKMAVMVTPSVSETMRDHLLNVFDNVFVVDILDSDDAAHLAMLERPELGITFTKLHCWRLTTFSKCVFMDADTMVMQNCDELFERDELSAAPDVGWPDCFNSGVFVFRPSIVTFENLIHFAITNGSFDGGDQGLLNQFFSDWSVEGSSRRLPFLYNMCSTACYSYAPAFKQFGENAKIVHFIGKAKPWLHEIDSYTGLVNPAILESPHMSPLLQKWWSIFLSDVMPKLQTNMCGMAGALAKLRIGEPRSEGQASLEQHYRRQAWEQGTMDYLGRDSFDNVWAKILDTLKDRGPAFQEANDAFQRHIQPSTEPQGSAENSSTAELTSQVPVAEAVAEAAAEPVAEPATEPAAELPEQAVSQMVPSSILPPSITPLILPSIAGALPVVPPTELPALSPLPPAVSPSNPTIENPIVGLAEVICTPLIPLAEQLPVIATSPTSPTSPVAPAAKVQTPPTSPTSQVAPAAMVPTPPTSPTSPVAPSAKVPTPPTSPTSQVAPTALAAAKVPTPPTSPTSPVAPAAKVPTPPISPTSQVAPAALAPAKVPTPPTSPISPVAPAAKVPMPPTSPTSPVAPAAKVPTPPISPTSQVAPAALAAAKVLTPPTSPTSPVAPAAVVASKVPTPPTSPTSPTAKTATQQGLKLEPGPPSASPSAPRSTPNIPHTPTVTDATPPTSPPIGPVGHSPRALTVGNVTPPATPPVGTGGGGLTPNLQEAQAANQSDAEAAPIPPKRRGGPSKGGKAALQKGNQ